MAKVSRLKIAAAVADRIAEGLSEQQLSREIAAYLLSTRRTGELDSVMRDVMELRADQGLVEVIAVSAHPITAAVRTDIEATMRTHFPTAKKVIVSEQLDTSVVGGVRLELANNQLDLSVRAKLSRFKQLTNTGV
jgi:F0F1-type ATP synthase delta subunit